MKKARPFDIAAELLAWYDAHARALPWRVPPKDSKKGVRPDPYRIWLSEIMLQQTTVTAVKPYFEKFLDLWPTVSDLGAAPREAVLAEWAGLGYYARARNLAKCAALVAGEYGGVFPDTEEELLKLPGVGPYTAAAVAAIAFGRPATVVDGNVERVMARLFAVETPLPDAKPEVRDLAERLTPQKRPGDYAQGLMDLGATICTPKSPACGICPVRPACKAFAAGVAPDLPRKKPKADKPTRYGAAFILTRPDGAVLLQRRAEKGLLGGMLGAPTGPWTEDKVKGVEAHAPVEADWRRKRATVRHTFTHFHLELTVFTGETSAKAAKRLEGEWTADPLNAGLPTVMRKVFETVS